MHILKANFNGTPNVGLYGYTAGNKLLLGEHLTDNLLAEVQKALDAEVHIFRVAGTGMPGIFLAGNSNNILVPSIAFDHELEHQLRLRRHRA
jgi:translation initiation factor 6